MKKMNLKKIIITSTVTLGITGILATSGYVLYNFSKKQKENTFVAPLHTTMKQFFNSNESVRVRKTMIGGEEGYVVNKGPIRITTAYNSLFKLKDLKEMAEWVNKDIAWGANAISLKNITFTTGIDKTEQGTTKGFHTASRDGSSIFISPDSFEELGSIGNRTFDKFTNKLIGDYQNKFVAGIQATSSNINKIEDDNGINSFLSNVFNGSASVASDSATFTPVDKNNTISFYKEILMDSWHDDYISKISGGQLGIISSSTVLGNLNFTSPERIAYLIQHNKMNEALNNYKRRLAFNTAYKLTLKATGGKRALGNTYLSLAIKDALFTSGEAKDANGVPIMYTFKPRSEWDDSTGLVPGRIDWNDVSQHPNILAKGIGNGVSSTGEKRYFNKLVNDYQISEKTANLRAAIYEIFVKAYDNAMDYINSNNSPYSVIKEMWNDKKVIASNTWINEVSHLKAPDRVRWLLTGELGETTSLNVLLSDEWMLTGRDKQFINALQEDDIRSRRVNVDIKGVYGNSINEPVGILGNKSISEHFKSNLIRSMRYTISHEYGHHETMWSSYGVYGKHSSNLSVFEDTLNIYSEAKAAKGEDYVSKSAIDYLGKLAEHDEGIRNVLDVIMTSADKYSSTWTPSFYQHYYSGFDIIKNEWTYSSEDLVQPQLVFKTDANGRKSISLGENENIGKTPSLFSTNGVDSQGNQNQTNYIYSIDKSKLDPDNAVLTDKRRLDDFIRLIVTPEELVYNYQLMKWKIEGNAPSGIIFPNINTQGLKEPTVANTPVLAQDPSDHKSKMMTMIGIIRLSLGLNDKDALDLIKQIDEQTKKLYDQLTSNAANNDLFDESITPPFERAKIIFKQIVKNTKETIGSNIDSYETLKTNFGIYYDPKAISYNDHLETMVDHDEILKRFSENQNGELVQEGTVVLGTAKSAFADYTGNFAEFMTRVVNQLQFRPDYDSYKNGNTLDKGTLTMENEGWYDDINRFSSYGLNLYNYKSSGAGSNITTTGIKLLKWYRELLGLHNDENNWINGNQTTLDDPISADPITKIFTNNKTKLTTAWGWIPEKYKDVYKYIILTNKETGQKTRIKINTKNTSNYFYRTNMLNGDSNKHLMNNGFVQWVSDWMIAGNFSNTDLNSGKYDLKFEDEKGNVYNPYNGNKNNGRDKNQNTNNDYAPTIAMIKYSSKYRSENQGEIEIEII